MMNDYEAMKIHQARQRDLLQEAHEHRLEVIARGPRKSLNAHLRTIWASINTKLYLSPANKGLDCVLLPSAC